MTDLSALKLHLRLDADDTSEDTLLEAKLAAATAMARAYTGTSRTGPVRDEAILKIAAELYENREADAAPVEALRLLDPFRNWTFG
ncbi:head-tail connector protein [Aureimonas leprariae]|uniref:head-tail connector protein n=1 Tax=Plantimonas leprariae TaxID=2615207 RepID=UPI001386A9F4|nr:head-tail connector protein [Aureimonas leprariae]